MRFISRLTTGFLTLLVTAAHCETENSQHLVFIGEKIEARHMERQPDEEGIIVVSLHREYRLRYKITKLLRGHHNGDVIEFTAFDHWGVPPFTQYRRVLFYITRLDGEYYIEPNQYTPVYKSTNGRWAVPMWNVQRNFLYSENKQLKPERITFILPVNFDVSFLSQELIEKYYPAPLFRIRNNRAIALYGLYVDDLFHLD